MNKLVSKCFGKKSLDNHRKKGKMERKKILPIFSFILLNINPIKACEESTLNNCKNINRVGKYDKKGGNSGGGEDRKSYQKDLQLDTDVRSKFLDLLGGIYPLLN